MLCFGLWIDVIMLKHLCIYSAHLSLSYGAKHILWKKTCSHQILMPHDTPRARSSLRPLRLKPQGPGADRGPHSPVRRKFSTSLAPKFLKRKICGFLETFANNLTVSVTLRFNNFRDGDRCQGSTAHRRVRSRFQASGPGGTMIRPWHPVC